MTQVQKTKTHVTNMKKCRQYVKGVRQKMLAYEHFLIHHPEYVGKVILIQVALPTTEANENGVQVSDVVARINSKFGSIEYLPVLYLHQDLSFNHYLALLSVCSLLCFGDLLLFCWG